MGQRQSSRSSSTNNLDVLSIQSCESMITFQRRIDRQTAMEKITSSTLKRTLQKQIDTLRSRYKYEEEEKEVAEVECPICLLNSSPATIITTACGHQFCCLCVENLRKHEGRTTCPFCRQKVLAYKLRMKIKISLLGRDFQ